MRIDKFLANLKYGTRKDVKKLIRDKRIRIEDQVIRSGSHIFDPNKEIVYFDNELIYYKERIVLMLNKPAGYLSANHDLTFPTVIELLKPPYDRFDLKIAGRLDKDTVGLMLLTNDGELLHNIITPKKNVYKKYYVKTKKIIKNIELLSKEFTIYDGADREYTPMTPIVEQISDNELYISIKEGKFHQIKRMVKYIKNEVIYLKRVSIGNIVLDESLALGEYKEIEIKESL
ncbi:MAG: pseudouridine synthase [Candidatus Izemoplasma sp.]